MIEQRIAEELAVKPTMVQAAIKLLDEGSTVPFISRYRKEATGGLDDSQLRMLEERLRYLRELEERRSAILQSVLEQQKLTPELRARICAADTKTRLEDLYLPFKKKRETRAQKARAAGLEVLADRLLSDPQLNPEQVATGYLNEKGGYPDVNSALEGARHVLMERFAEDADLIADLRESIWQRTLIRAKLVRGKEQEGAKFRDYFDHVEVLGRMPSHRALAILRARKAGIIRLQLHVDGDREVDSKDSATCQGKIARKFGIRDQGRAADPWLQAVVRLTWRTKCLVRLEAELVGRVREAAETEAIDVFANNLKDLLLQAPAGRHAVLGLDPGLRTGVKVAVVDATGKVLETGAIYPHAPRNDWQGSLRTLSRMMVEHGASLVAIGNGTASRETERLARDLFKDLSNSSLKKVVVSEAGASIYSASELASLELPDLDVTVRGAVSIARRLQDPLAELVKIDPKSIGVGQYQHDVDQAALARSLEAVVEDCVNAVGVDLNTASTALLSRVSGLSHSLAKNIVEHRDSHGAFQNRQQLLKVKRLGNKAFEQAAGFLRVADGDNPLDCSGVHPEAYSVVERLLQKSGQPLSQILGNSQFLAAVDVEELVEEKFGMPTIIDILSELEKPGRDPRPEFTTAEFEEGVEKLSDLTPGMVLEGVVSNVANFGAFVDLGVHQDGLVHISRMADRFVSDPREIVRAGEIVKVKVLSVDMKAKRVSLSLRLEDPIEA